MTLETVISEEAERGETASRWAVSAPSPRSVSSPTSSGVRIPAQQRAVKTAPTTPNDSNPRTSALRLAQDGAGGDGLHVVVQQPVRELHELGHARIAHTVEDVLADAARRDETAPA